jgi:hypothetical protein
MPPQYSNASSVTFNLPKRFVTVRDRTSSNVEIVRVIYFMRGGTQCKIFLTTKYSFTTSPRVANVATILFRQRAKSSTDTLSQNSVRSN